MRLMIFVLLPIVLAIIMYLLKYKASIVASVIFQIGLFIYSIVTFVSIKVDGPISEVIGNYPQNVGITLQADLIASVFVMLTCFLFTVMFVYNSHKHYMDPLFMFLFLVLEGLINGIFLSMDLFNIYIIVEVSTIIVSILIMYKKDSRSIYDGMLYLLINLVGMTFFLLGTGYIYKIFGTLNMNTLQEMVKHIDDPKVLVLPYCMIITAVGLKSAIMPLFSWLPRAHGTPSAPSIVSAILSGLYVKGGVYLFIRIQDIMKPALNTDKLFLIAGFLTAVIGFLFALSQTDLKLILAYHTISQIGLIIFGVSLNNQYSYYGSIYHIVNHAIFKSTLFLTAGIIIDEYGTRDIRKIKGVFRRMPFVSIVTLMAIFGITGAPLFNGSVSKYLIQKGTGGTILEYGLLIINFGTILSFVKYSSIFHGRTSAKKFSPPLNQKIVVLLLGILCFLGGILGTQFIEILFNYSIQISKSSYIIKTMIYFVSIILGLLFYRYFYKRIKLFSKIREIELSFNQICFSIILFFAFSTITVLVMV